MIDLRTTELFSGVSMQKRGMDNSNVFNIISVETCEIEPNAIIGRAAMHNGLTNEMVESYADYPSRDEMIDYLTMLNIGFDFKKNKPYNWGKKRNSKNKDLEKTWLACKLSNNIGDISKVDHLQATDLLFYSSPCTDYSQAGKQQGNKCTCTDCGFEFNVLDYDVHERNVCPNCGSENILGTRSGTLAEVERLLLDMVKRNEAPMFLIQENVDALVSKKFIGDFEKWCNRLDRLGYNNYRTVINGCVSGIPQHRKRLFMVSIRKDIDTGKFEFPIPYDCGLRLMDVLDKKVDDKYFIKTPKAQALINSLILNGEVVEE